MYYIYYYLQEIRLRIVYILLAFIWSFLVGYFYKYEFFYLLSKPFLKFHRNFIFFDFTEGLSTIIHIVGIICFFVIIPYIFYHFWSFSAPSWYISERNRYRKIINLFAIFCVIEFLCVYLFVFPKICEFLISFEIQSLESTNEALLNLEFTPRIASYITLFSRLILFCLAVFQLPFLFLGLFSKKIISCYHLCQYRKLVFFFSLLISALISPPDVLSQLFISLILYIMYEIIIFIGFYKQLSL